MYDDEERAEGDIDDVCAFCFGEAFWHEATCPTLLSSLAESTDLDMAILGDMDCE